MAEEHGRAARPPSGQYPEPQPYPSPQMRPTYAWPPAQGQSNEAYRQSPGQSSAPLPPIMNLPPLRSIDPQSQSQPPSHSPLHPNGAAAQQQGPPLPGYYPPPPPPSNIQHHNHTSAPQLMRYAPIPQGDAHLMAGSRHKKEIKRRTKTGCLTCRKRRIKCDEQHPACRNCQKSKRECLGYDPIFKQQSGPQQLQPAPSASPSSTSSPLDAHPAPPSNYQPVPPSYPPQSNSGYAPSPSPHPAHPTLPPPASPRQAPPQQHQRPQSYEYTSAIDPALAGAESTAPGSPPHRPPRDQYSRRTPPPSTSAHSIPPLKMEKKPARLIQIEELFSADRHGSPDAQTPRDDVPADAMNEIKSLYSNDYAPGLDGILETSWFSTSGWARLSANKANCQLMAQLIDLFKRPAGGYEHEVRCRTAETKVVWQLLNLIRPSTAISNGTNGSSSSTTLELDEGIKRLDVLEALLTNRILDSHHMSELVYPSDISSEKTHEVEFWKSLGNFVSHRSDDASAAHVLDTALRQCRDNLFSKENRDVLYSGMIARHVGARVPEFPDQILPVGPGLEDNDFNKLYIAKTFLSEQATHKGTNNAIMRICDMISRSWSVR